MTTFDIPELWAFQALLDDLSVAGIRYLVIYGEPYDYSPFSLEDRERIVIVRLAQPRVEAHVLFLTPGYHDEWIPYIKDTYL